MPSTIEFLQIDLPAMLAALLATLVCALLGNFLLLRRQSLMSDAISHAVLPGIVLGFVLAGTRASWPIFLGALVAAVVAALLVDLLKRLGRLESGTAMGVVFSIMFALGLVLTEALDATSLHLEPDEVLFGQLEYILWLAPTGWASLAEASVWADLPRQVTTLGVVLAVLIVVVVVGFKELTLTSFDPALASALGLPAGWVNAALMVAVGAAAVAAFEAVGAILVIAMFVCPPAAARLCTDRLVAQILYSLGFGAVAAIAGYVAAAWAPHWFGSPHSLAASGMIAVMTGVILAATILLAPRYGILARWRR